LIGDARKALVTFLGKLNLLEPESAADWMPKAIRILLSTIREKRPFGDAPSKNALKKFESLVEKKYSAQLQPMDHDAWRGSADEHLQEVFGFVDDV